MLILGIETSCDETAASVVEAKAGKFAVKSNVVLSQIDIHRKFGGVVPEVAARKHLENILPVIDQALRQAKVKMEKIDRIAVTHGPGLITSLMVGIEAAKVLSYVYNKPLVGVNHLEGHLLVHSPKSKVQRAVGLIVSGGHTELILIKKIGDYKKIGQTLDDAAGECLDKTSKMLGLGYPGGPEISAKAKNGNPRKFDLPSPMLNKPGFDFSFAGLKTSVLYFVQKNGRPRGQALNDFCAAIEDAVVKVLVSKTIKAAEKYKVKSIILGGGVAANKELRRRMGEEIKKYRNKEIGLQLPEVQYCGDNAVMIAVAGFYHQPGREEWKRIVVDPNLEIGGKK